MDIEVLSYSILCRHDFVRNSQLLLALSVLYPPLIQGLSIDLGGSIYLNSVMKEKEYHTAFSSLFATLKTPTFAVNLASIDYFS